MMNTPSRHRAFFFLLAFTIATPTALAQTYDFTDANHRNTISILLDAPFESINGIANDVRGTVTVKDGRATGSFEVKVDSIRTGNSSRDEHLTQAAWLNAQKWPFLGFSFANLTLPKNVDDGAKHEVRTVGTFSVHGVTKQMPVTVEIQRFAASALTAKRLDGNLFRVRANFQIKLADYGIAQSDSKVKSLIGLKVGEVAEVRVDFFGTDAG